MVVSRRQSQKYNYRSLLSETENFRSQVLSLSQTKLSHVELSIPVSENVVASSESFFKAESSLVSITIYYYIIFKSNIYS